MEMIKSRQIRFQEQTIMWQILKGLGVLLIVTAVLYHESGLTLGQRQIFKAFDIAYTQTFGAVRTLLGFSPPAPEQTLLASAKMTAVKNSTTDDEAMLRDPKTLNVKTFGAKGNGITDDTKAIQQAVDAVPAAGGTVVVPEGTYLIEALQSVRIKSGVTFYMVNGAVLKALPNRSERYSVLTIENANNVHVIGGSIVGDRKRHIGNSGQWGTGIQISGAKNVTIERTAANECWGDGFYIGTETFTGEDNLGKVLPVPENIRLIDVYADYNRRQGISLIAGRNVEIVRPRLVNTKGTDPSAGLDIEPNDPTDIVENIVVTDAFTARNAGAGILVNLSELLGTKIPASIKIFNHHDEGSERGMFIVDSSTKDHVTPGSVLIETPEWLNSRKSGIAISNHDYRSYNITIKEPQIINANYSGSKFDIVSGAAIAIYHDRGNIPSRTGALGNIMIYHPVIRSEGNAPKLLRSFYIWDDVPGHPIQKLVIVDPVIPTDLTIPEEIKSYIQ